MPKGKHLPRVEQQCAVCGRSFSRVGSDVDRRHCSYQCANVSKRKPTPARHCIGCGILFKPKKHYVTYCRKGCVRKSKARREHEAGIFLNRKIAKSVLLKETRACQLCGWNVEPSILELHHKDRNRRHNHISNLIVICPNCHTLDHYKHRDGQFASSLGRPKSGRPKSAKSTAI
jgi:HNH endonuclease